MNAYSRLKQILKQRQISIPELQRRLAGSGLRVNVKSLYRLNDDRQPVERLDMRVAGAICQVIAVPLSEWIIFEEEPERLHKFDSAKQARLDLLMARNNAGTLTETERSELEELVREAEELTIANARLLMTQRQRLASARKETVSSAS